MKRMVTSIIYLSNAFPFHNIWDNGDAISPFLYNFALSNAIRKLQENHEGLKLNGTHQLLVYVDDADLLGENINAIKRNVDYLLA
jgi:hypothetical protein